jgi:uncharacterized RDD family membrane protein YckC
MEYAGFWRRFGAYLLDILVFLPVMLLEFWGNEQSRLFQLYWFIPSLILSLWFHVYLVKRYGGTPGKILLKIKISKLDGADVGYREALLRHSVLLIMSLIVSASLIPVTLQMTDAQYFLFEWKERAMYMTEHAPAWHKYSNIMINIWIWGEFIIMLTNKKRRALHDFMAGTVVIRNNA